MVSVGGVEMITGPMTIGVLSQVSEQIIIPKWTLRQAFGNFPVAVTYGKGIWVAIGLSTTYPDSVMVSYDKGKTWIIGTLPDNDCTFMGLAYGNGIFVAVSAAGVNRAIYSTDGLNWNRASGQDNSLYYHSVCFGNNQFVAVGNSGALMTSPDGITWIQRPNSIYQTNYNSIIYNNKGLYVAVGGTTSFRVSTSPDSITWTSRSVGGSPATGTLYGVEYGESADIYVAVCNAASGNRLVTSPDGVSWTARPSPLSAAMGKIAYGNNLFIIVGNVVSAISINGLDWDSVAVIANHWRNIEYGDRTFVTVTNLTSGAGEGYTVMTMQV